MAGGRGYPGRRVKRQLTRGPISSLTGRAECRRLSLFRQANSELDSPGRRPMLRLQTGEDISRSPQALC